MHNFIFGPPLINEDLIDEVLVDNSYEEWPKKRLIIELGERGLLTKRYMLGESNARMVLKLRQDDQRQGV